MTDHYIPDEVNILCVLRDLSDLIYTDEATPQTLAEMAVQAARTHEDPEISQHWVSYSSAASAAIHRAALARGGESANFAECGFPIPAYLAFEVVEAAIEEIEERFYG